MDGRVILLVEDNADDVELARLAFARVQVAHELVVATDGLAALDHLRHADALPALVLLDLQLPGIRGLDVLRRIREEPRSACVPVTVMTSSMHARDVGEAYRLGASSYVRKPVDFDEFLRLAATLAHYWLTVNIVPERNA